jgi:ZIP family zinc transporter
MIPTWLQAGLWGLVAGSALIAGTLAGYFMRLPQRLIAGVMSFGSGVLISALSFDLMDEAYKSGGFDSTSIGFVGGALIYTAANIVLAKAGAKHRKRSGDHQRKEKQKDNNGIAIAIGSLLDGIPESIVIGLSLIKGSVSMVAVIAIFLSNIPESLSSVTGMKKAGRSAMYIFSLWIGIAVLCGVASLCGFVIFAQFNNDVVAATTAVAAGAILSMISDTMIPEAFEVAHNYAGLITVLGFLCAFILTKIA